MGDRTIPIKIDATPKIGNEGDAAFTMRSRENGGGINDMVLTPWDVQSKRVNSPQGTSPTLQSGTGEGMNIQPIVLQGGGTTSLSCHGMGYEDDGACYTLNNVDQHAVAFAQNTRDEVRVFGEDGKTVGALAAQPGMKQTCYLCIADDNAKAAIDENMSGSLKVGGVSLNSF